MATKFDLKKSITGATPLYAAVGAADTVYTTVRDRALTVGAELKPSAVQVRFTKQIADVREQVEALPATATKVIDDASIEAGDQYVTLAKRGEKVVKSLRKQVDGIETTARKQAKDVRSTARKTAKDAQTTAVSTLAAGRKDAAKVVADVAGKVEDEARAEVRSNAAKEGAATKRPARKTVAKKATARKTTARKAPAKKAASANSNA